MVFKCFEKHSKPGKICELFERSDDTGYDNNGAGSEPKRQHFFSNIAVLLVL